jgi:transketolase
MNTVVMKKIASTIRRRVIELSHSAGTPHLGSSLSCIDILTTLYWSILKLDPQQPDHPDRDRFILSKGHAALALYVTLAERGFFAQDVLETYNCDGGCLAEHPGPACVPGVEAATGSLGHGLPLGIGMALAARLKKSPARVFVLLGDGECNEGSVWEAAMMAPAHDLGHLAIIVDYNKWQATARSNETLSLAPLAAKWRAFGWQTCEVDGHDIDQLFSALHPVPTASGKPLAVIAHTIKGRGVSFMEDDNNWHYRIPSAEEVRQAAQELQSV